MEHAEVPGMDREHRLREWIDAYADAVLKTCCLILADRGQAEDAAQDTWIKAWKHMDSFEKNGIGNVKAWLLRIAVNTCRDYRRTSWFRHVDLGRALEELPPRLVAVEPEDRTLTLTVMELPERFRQVILLYYYQDLTLQEVSQVLGLAPSTVHRRLRKAEGILKASLTGGAAYEG